MNLRRHFTALILCFFLFAALVSCSKNNDTPPPADPPPSFAETDPPPSDTQKGPYVVPSGSGNIQKPASPDPNAQAPGTSPGTENPPSGTEGPPSASTGTPPEKENPSSSDPEIIEVPEGEEFYKIVVNKNYSLPEDFEPKELETMYKSSYKLEKTASGHLTELLKDMEKEGLSVYPTSGFRTQKKQSELFKNKISQYKKTYPAKNEQEVFALAASIVAVPGTSEHQTGLAVDLTKDGTLQASFGKTKEGIWLAENCHKYGFIIRYPKDKESVTTITYEPWHLRYVGIGLAEDIKNSGLCLEEYFDKPAVAKE